MNSGSMDQAAYVKAADHFGGGIQTGLLQRDSRPLAFPKAPRSGYQRRAVLKESDAMAGVPENRPTSGSGAERPLGRSQTEDFGLRRLYVMADADWTVYTLGAANSTHAHTPVKAETAEA
ncbi:hypothetical protein LTS10_011427 [Elasticomyces elasticus]|nr:hypothetical protein LTS10_011427 [Elasticomyces elasticus]